MIKKFLKYNYKINNKIFKYYSFSLGKIFSKFQCCGFAVWAEYICIIDV